MKSTKKNQLQTREVVSDFEIKIQTIRLQLEKIRVKGESILSNPKAAYLLPALKELIIQNSLHPEKLKKLDQNFLENECKENYLSLYFQDLIELAKMAEQKEFSFEADWLLKITEEQSRFFANRAPFWLGIANLFARIYLQATIEDFMEQSTQELQEMVRNSPNAYHPILWHILFTDYIHQKTEFLVSNLAKLEEQGASLNPEGIYQALRELKGSIPLFSLVR